MIGRDTLAVSPASSRPTKTPSPTPRARAPRSSPARSSCNQSDLYATHGVGHLWIVDPLERLLEAYELMSGRWTRLGAYDDTVTARIPPFEAIELDVGELFPPLDAVPR